MVDAILMREQNYLNRSPLTSYGDGGFRTATRKYTGSILYLPSGIYPWNVNSNQFGPQDFAELIAESANIEVLLIGAGVQGKPLSAEAAQFLRSASIPFEIMSTPAACRSFNVLLGDQRAVAAALYAID